MLRKNSQDFNSCGAAIDGWWLDGRKSDHRDYRAADPSAHIQNWNGGSKTLRNVCVTPFEYNSDGTIRIIDATEKCLHKAQ